MKRKGFITLLLIAVVLCLVACKDSESNSTRRSRNNSDKNSENNSKNESEQEDEISSSKSASNGSLFDTPKVKRDEPPVLLKETYYNTEGSGGKPSLLEQWTTIYKYNSDGLFIRSNRYDMYGTKTESLEKVLKDDWSQKYVEYDKSGNLVATLRDDGENTRYDEIYIYDNEGRMIKRYYNLDRSATLSNIIADTVTNYIYDEKGNNIRIDRCRIGSDGSENIYETNEIEYDEKGNKISDTITSKPMQPKSVYIYDENNRLLCLQAGNKVAPIETVEEYDGYGHRTYFHGGNYYCAHEYNEDGQLIKCTYTGPSQGQYTYYTEEYNEWGQIIKKTEHDFYKWKVNSVNDLKNFDLDNVKVFTYMYGYPEDFDMEDLISDDNFSVTPSTMILDEAEFNRQLETIDN